MAVSLASCEQPSPPPEAAAASRAPLAASEAVAPRILTEVTWPPDGRIDRAAWRALPEAAAQAARRARVPVLVPTRSDLLASPVIVTKDQWTSFWAKTPEMTVTLMMTRLSRTYDSIAPARGPHAVRGRAAFVTSNEGIWSATWMENGVSYTLDVECASPRAAACGDSALLLELASGLAYIGGAGAARGGTP